MVVAAQPQFRCPRCNPEAVQSVIQAVRGCLPSQRPAGERRSWPPEHRRRLLASGVAIVTAVVLAGTSSAYASVRQGVGPAWWPHPSRIAHQAFPTPTSTGLASVQRTSPMWPLRPGRMSNMETMEKKKPGPRRAFTDEVKTDIVERCLKATARSPRWPTTLT